MTITIGDTPRLLRGLAGVLTAVALTRKDTVVTLGDYTDHGPDSKCVIGLPLVLVGCCKLVPLKGDYEEMFLDALGC